MLKKNFMVVVIILSAIVLVAFSQAHSTTTDTDKRRNAVEEKIWALEKAYFTNLYSANYSGVLAMVHSQFLGWPDAAPQPVDKNESAQFMKQLIPQPTSCTFKIERAGIRVLENVALTQYLIHVNCSNAAGVTPTQSSRITHTWVREGSQWKLLGGMSHDQ